MAYGFVSAKELLEVSDYLEALPRPVEGQGSDAATYAAACGAIARFGQDNRDNADLVAKFLRDFYAPHFDFNWLKQKAEQAITYRRIYP